VAFYLTVDECTSSVDHEFKYGPCTGKDRSFTGIRASLWACQETIGQVYGCLQIRQRDYDMELV
jgi:hypothetical protein